MAAAAGLVAKQVELQNGIISYFDAKSGKTTQVLINDINLEIPEQVILKFKPGRRMRECMARLTVDEAKKILKKKKSHNRHA